MKKLLLPLVLLINQTCYPQGQTDKWYFGIHSAIDFSGGVPIALANSAIATNEGCATISDASGILLFYTDGVTVWNKNHAPMPNGTGLLGGISSTQSALIIPKPGSTSLYYVFTVDEFGGPNGFRYTVVDMSLLSGLGDVDPNQKNILVQNNVTEKLTAIHNSTGNSIWVAIHEWGNNTYNVYSLDATGFQTTPVASSIGISHALVPVQNCYGQLKFNSCGTKLAAAVGYLDTVEVFDFNAATGVISNPVTIPMTAHVYGIEFSDDGNFLYVSNYDPLGTLVQFDLTSGNQATIIASKTILSQTPDIYGLQIGIDEKIYVTRSFSSFLGVIDQPTVAGIGCNYIDNGVDLDPNFMGNTSGLSLPGFMQSFFRNIIECPFTGIEENNHSSTPVYPNPFSDEFILSIEEKNKPSNIIANDVTGRLVEERNIGSSEKSIAMGKNWSSGAYFIIIRNEISTETLRIIKY